jgi:hypothetical protein
MLVPDFAAVRYFFNYRFPHVFHRVIAAPLNERTANVKGPYYRVSFAFNASNGFDFRVIQPSGCAIFGGATK